MIPLWERLVSSEVSLDIQMYYFPEAIHYKEDLSFEAFASDQLSATLEKKKQIKCLFFLIVINHVGI